jgi:hypothetical protein
VGDAEGLVEVQVTHVSAQVAGGGDASLGVHVGAVHVHLCVCARETERESVCMKVIV